MNDLQCPCCKSNSVTEISDDLLCLSCGNRENLYDYPIHKPECDYYPKDIEEVRIVHITQPPVDTLRALNLLDKDMQEHFKSHRKPYKKGKYD